MGRTEQGLKKALKLLPELKTEFYRDLLIQGDQLGFNQMLEKALRVADFIEFGEVLCLDALTRNESCGGHFREEYQTPDGEALRNDDDYCHVSCWQHQEGQAPNLIKEPLVFEAIKLQQRSYK